MSKPIFTVSNHHATTENEPPEISDDDRNLYVGYFQNEHGEQWTFTFDRTTRIGELRGGDVDWKALQVTDADGAPRVDMVLNAGERLWLQACWKAATAFGNRR